MTDTPGAQVDEQLAQQQQNAEAAIAQAKRDADAAAAQAKQIADAALSSELGQRIEAQRGEFHQWQTTTETRLSEMAEAQRQSQAELQKSMTLLGSIRELLTPVPKPQASDQNPDTVPTGENSIKTVPNVPHAAPAPVKAEHAPTPPTRKRHFL